MPTEFKRYCEPFFGGGAVYWRLRIDKPSVINDYNENIVALLRCVKNNRNRMDTIKEMPRNKETFNIIKNWQPNLTSNKAWRFLYLLYNTYSVNWKCNKSGKFSCYFIKGASKKNYPFFKRLENPRYKQQLQNATITNKDYKEVMIEYDNPDTFMFLDPPYHETMEYKTPFTDIEHRNLAFIFKTNYSKCLMIINKTELTSELYKRYIVEEYVHRYDMQGAPDRIHMVVKNY